MVGEHGLGCIVSERGAGPSGLHSENAPQLQAKRNGDNVAEVPQLNASGPIPKDDAASSEPATNRSNLSGVFIGLCNYSRANVLADKAP